VKPAIEPIPTSRVRPKSLEPAVLGRVPSKDPARDQARRLARDKDLKPTRSSPSSVPETLDTVLDQMPKRKPSRASRSMKSRQSEPRASKTGRTKSSARKPVKPPVVLMAVAAAVVVFGLIMLPRVFQSSPRRVTQVDYAAANALNAGVATRPAVNVQTNTPSIGRTITTTSSQVQKPALNLTPSEKIQLEQIAGYESGIPPVIVFRDGSKLNADPVVIGRLRADVRMQLTYSREPQ
jgi:hypothetical protein